MNQVVLTPEQQFYVSKLLGYDYDIIYRPGKLNLTADALSRRDEDSSLQAYIALENLILSSLQQVNASDAGLVQLHAQF